jgi:hypothetical protein
MTEHINEFKSIWLAPSMILGLAITKLLSDAVTIFRSRHKSKIDYIPIIWAISIFLWQIQYLWAVIELSEMQYRWQLIDYILLIILSSLLYVSAALILPDSEPIIGDNYESTFMTNGKWALASLSCWAVIAYLFDLKLFNNTPLGQYSILMIINAMTSIMALFTRKRSHKGVFAIIYLLLTIFTAWTLSPKSY